MRFFLGVDGGQSGTTALIGDDAGRVLGSGSAGPCNHACAQEGRGKLESAVTGSVAAACRIAGIDPALVCFEAACFGMSGGPEDKEAILGRLLRVNRLTVTNDAVIALAGATESGEGIIAIAGTGSIALGQNSERRTARAGGWGYVFGDEGGAFDIVRQGIRAALRMDEGWGVPTALRAALVGAIAAGDADQAHAARDANGALHRLYTAEWPRNRIATLAPLVDAAAEQGDAVAREILANAAGQLAMLAASVRSQLWKPGELVEVAYVGGVFQSRLLLERFRMLVELEDGCRCEKPKRGPAEGALLEAYRSAGMRMTLRP